MQRMLKVNGLVCVAKMAGYRSANYLHRQFLKRFRMTPEEWRRRSGKDRVRF